MSIEKRQDGSGRVRWFVRTRNAQNKPITKTFDRKADAESWEADRNAERRKGVSFDPTAGKLTLGEYLDEIVTRRVWEETTARQWVRAIEWSGFSDRPLSSITKIQGETLVATMVKRGYALNTIRNRVGMCRQLLKAAAEDGRIGQNPWQGLKTPKIKRADHELEIPTRDEIGLILAVADDELALQVHLGAHAGLRVGEVVALRPECVRADDVLLVNWQHIGGKLRPPKHGSARDVFIPSALTRKLKERASAVGGPYLFPRERKRGANADEPEWPLASCTTHRRWSSLMRELDMSYPFRALRHYYATSQLSAGTDVCTVSKAMGHSSVDITQRVYIHWLPDNRVNLRRASELMMQGAENAALEESGTVPVV